MTGPVRSHRPAVVVVGLAVALTACGPAVAGTTLAQQVSNWAKGTSPTFSTSIDAIQGDIRRIDAVGDDGADLPADCDLLVTDVLNANQNLPTPDQTLTGLLSSAYDTAGAAGHNCLSSSAADRQRSTAEREAARHALIRALARYDFVTTP